MNNSLFNPIFNEINEKCCFSINNNEKILIENFFKKLIYTYINASVKITKHSKKNIISLSDIKLVDDFISDETILLSTEINKDVNDSIQKTNSKKQNKIDNNLNIKSININFTKNIANKLLDNIDKKIKINDGAIKYLNDILLKFSLSFFNRCNNHCRIKQKEEKINKPHLSSNDIYYILIR